jgi:TetR/AcrR family transcriptional regulator, transcriptional repressor for nem operon
MTMRYSNEHKEQTAANILDAAERCFRLKGFGGIGVDGLAQGAGVTSGAFYKHYRSKAEAFDSAVEAGLQDYRNNIEQFMAEHGSDWLPALIDYYLSTKHRTDLAGGCVVPGLTADVIRQDGSTKAVYQEGIEGVANVMANGLDSPDQESAKSRAWAMLALLAGGVMLSRAVQDEKLAQTIADAVKKTAMQKNQR